MYTYDAIGNITAAGSHKMTYDNDSRLTSVDGDKTTVDKDGNLTAYTMSGKSHTAIYNSQNQLTKYDDLSYTYDADGNRVSAGDTKFVYDDNGHLLSDSTNTYVYGASGVVGYYDKDNKFVTYLFNQRGDVVKETDELGSVANSFDYNDYGKLTSSDHVAGSVFGYGGQYGAVTDKNGLVFLRTRYYNPEIMRFMNRDTVRGSVVDTKSLNRFSYVEGNPLTYVDPNGEAATWFTDSSNLTFLHDTLGVVSLIPGLGSVASIGMMAIDLAKGDYTSLAMDSLGILIPGAAVGLKLSYDGVRAITTSLKLGNISFKLGDRVVKVVSATKAFHAQSVNGFSKVFLNNNNNRFAIEFVGDGAAGTTKSIKYSESAEKVTQNTSNASSASKVYSFGEEYTENDIRFAFSKRYKEPNSSASSDLPNANNPQRHHILQNEWAEQHLAKYGYKKSMAPTITLETGSSMKYGEEYPHTAITNSQRNRRLSRMSDGLEPYPSDIQTALENSKNDLLKAGIPSDAVDHAMSLVENMLSHLNVPR